jgi:hypothetical protein
MTIQQMHPVAHWPLVLGVLRRLEVATHRPLEVLVIALQDYYYSISRFAHFFRGFENLVVSLNCRDEVLSAEYHKIRAAQGRKVP